MWTIAAYSPTGWLGLRVGVHVVLSQVNSRIGCGHGDITISIDIGVIRPHRRTTYVDAAYNCYKVAWSVSRSVCLTQS